MYGESFYGRVSHAHEQSMSLVSLCKDWHAYSAVVDFENMYNCSCEKAQLTDCKSLRRRCNDTGHLYHLVPTSGNTGTHAQ